MKLRLAILRMEKILPCILLMCLNVVESTETVSHIIDGAYIGSITMNLKLYIATYYMSVRITQ